MRALTLPVWWDDPVLEQAEAASLLAQPGHVLLVAEVGGHLLGRSGMDENADIITIFVPPAQRQRGLATALLLAFMQQIKAAGGTGLTLEVRADNTAALALYNSAGLQQVHRRVGYYAGVDAVVMGVDF
jgi:[ribosomal protein S18]-alanine N-acetyltransferase